MKTTYKDSVLGQKNAGQSKLIDEESQINDGEKVKSYVDSKVCANTSAYLKKIFHGTISSPLAIVYVLISVLLITFSGCAKFLEEQLLEKLPGASVDPSYQQVNLVSDTAGFNAKRIDTTLVNAWGIAINPSGIFWISSNDAKVSEVYDQNGLAKRLPVTIPFQNVARGGNPTGQVFNNTTDFIMATDTLPAKFIFATENGTIAAWNKGNSAFTVVDRSAMGTVYKGLALANDGMANFLFAADFHNAKIDVFDKNFSLVTNKPFMDSKIPEGFAPFNIRLLAGRLYVTYAKQLAPNNHDDEKGPGNGFVDIFDLNGSLVKRFASKGVLNSPWGIDLSAPGFGQGNNAILIGNFGDGRINVFDEHGEFVRALKNYGKTVSIEGLWAITFPDGNIPGADPNLLYFTAGPYGESHGLFGYLKNM